jgi:fibronectin-binding autotransporter adhesin
MTSTDVATFGTSLTANRIVAVDTNRNISGITFSNTSGFGYTLSGGNILLSSGGVIQTTTSGGTHTDSISSPIEIQGDGGTATFGANSATVTRLLSIEGTVSGIASLGKTTALALKGANTGANTVAGNISDGLFSGKLSVTKSEAGTWYLSGTNSYTGGTSVTAGALFLGPSATLATTGNITINGNGATLDLGGTTQTISGVIALNRGTLKNGKIINNSGNYTTNTADGITVSAVLDGTAGYTKTGASFVTLSGDNTYSGGTLLTAGTIRLGHVNGLGTGTLTFNGGTLGLSSNLGTIGTAMGANTDIAYKFDTLSFSTTVSADLGANGTNELTKASTGTLTLSGNNTYTGGTRINAGSLSLGSANAVGSTGAISFGGGTLQFTSSNTTDYSARFSTAASQAFRVDTNGQSVTLGTGLSSTGGSLVKIGAGTLTLSGSNTYDSGTSVSVGTLLLSGGNDRLSTTGNISFGTGADTDGINLGGNTQNTSGNVTLGRGTLSNGTINLTGAGAYSLTAKANVSANLQGTATTAMTVNNGSNTATLSGNNTFGGGVTITGTATSVLSIGSATALGTGTLTFDGGTLGSTGSLGTVTISNAITATISNAYRFNPGSGTTLEITSDLAGASNGVSKSEAGSVIFNGNKSYGGITTISRGTLSVTSLANGESPSSIGNSTNAAANLLIGGSSASNPSILQYVGTSAASTNRLFTAVQGPAGSSLANSAVAPAHTVTFSNTGSIVMSGTGTRTIGLGGTNTGDNTFALQIDNEGANATSFTKRDAGKWILTGANTYTGVTTIAAGTLLIGGTQTAATGTITVKSTGLLGGNGSSGGAAIIESGGGLAAKIIDWTGSAGTGYHDLAIVGLNAGNVPMKLNIDTTGITNFTESARSFTILNTSGGITNFNPANVTITAPGFIGTGTWSVAVVTDSLVLTYTAGSGSGTSTFAGWASSVGISGGVNDDSDNDGIPNGVEYGLNTNPNGSDGSVGTYTGNVLSFNKRLLTSGNSDLSYRIEISPDLGVTPWVEVSPYLTNTTSVISATIPTGPVKNFGRLRVVVNP